MPHTFLEHSHYPRQRQDHLDVGIGFGGKPAELLHGALLVNLISFLHSDSPFSWKKNFPEAITPRGVRVATFYGLPGNFRRRPLMRRPTALRRSITLHKEWFSLAS